MALISRQRQNFLQLLLYYIGLSIFILIIGIASLIVFFAYEEYVSSTRADQYSELGIKLSDDVHQADLERHKMTVKSLVHILGAEGAKMFANLDRDGNGLISLPEMEPTMHHIRTLDNHPINSIPLTCSGSNCLRLAIDVKPPILCDGCAMFFRDEDEAHSNLTDFFCHLKASSDCRAQATQHERALLHHITPISHDQSRLVDQKHFEAFLPTTKIKVGEVYPLIEKIDDGITSYFQMVERSGGYIDIRHRALASILNHLHVGGYIGLYPLVLPRLSLAILRATNADYLDIHFWFHVELAGNSTSKLSMSPGALIGRTVIRRRDHAVMFFSLTEKSQRAGVTAQQYEEDNLFMGELKLPQMEMRFVDDPIDISTITWQDSISIDEAHEKLRKAMLGDKLPKFLSLSDLLERRQKPGQSSTSGRPIILLVTIGHLNDMSCGSSTCAQFRSTLNSPEVSERLHRDFEVASVSWTELMTAKGEEAANFVKALKAASSERQSLVWTGFVLSSDGRKIQDNFSVLDTYDNRTPKLTRAKTPGSEQEKEDPLLRNLKPYRGFVTHIQTERKTISEAAVALLKFLGTISISKSA